MFASMHFRNDPRFDQIQRNALALRDGSSGYHVRILQQGLLDLGYDLTKSTQRHRSPDGIFGRETKAGVERLQSKLGLYDDGVVGPKSVAKFDPALAAVAGGFAAPPALPGKTDGDKGNPAADFRDAALRAIGPGSPLFKTDKWTLNWKPRKHAKTLSFTINTFIDYGLSLNAAITAGDLSFQYINGKGKRQAEYISKKGQRRGVKADTVLLLNKDAISEELAIHELTHAVMDYERAPQNMLFGEMFAFIAVSLFALQKGYKPVMGGDFAAVSKAANECAEYIKLGQEPSQKQLDALGDAINVNPGYRGVRGQKGINDGIG